MKQLLIMVLTAFISCSSQQPAEQHEHNIANDKKDEVVTVPVSSSAKWKADEATKKNVAALMQVVNDSMYADARHRNHLYMNLKTKTDVLIKECSMQGAEHEALHVWLEKLLKDLKQLKKGDSEYSETYTALKNDIANFYQSFE